VWNLDSMFEVPIRDEDLNELREVLKEIKRPIKILTFVADRCRYCGNTVKLVDLIARASPRADGGHLIENKVIRYSDSSQKLFREYGVTRVPTIVLLDGYIRYVGMPAGEEVRGFVETLIRIGSDNPGLQKRTADAIARVRKPVKIEVVVTPTCPYCPYASLLANMFAFESYRKGLKTIVSMTIEAYENPDIADMYNVMTVPAIAINHRVEFVGPPTEEQFIERILRIAGNS